MKKIHVVYPDEKRGVVEAAELQRLIDQGLITSFVRSDGQKVTLGVDPIRGDGGKKYRGPERRGNILFG